MEARFKAVMKFWQDADLPREEVYESCERCHLSLAECPLRAAEPVLYEKNRTLENRKSRLDTLISELRGN